VRPLAQLRNWFQQALRITAILHREYGHKGLVEQKVPDNPYLLFKNWFQEALKAKALDPTAMTLATVTPSGRPAVRTVLLKEFSSEGFIFYTNYESQKGTELSKKPVASLLFYWPALVLQVRVDGKVVRVSAKESDDYFNSRPRGSQLSAWASRQSRVVPSREFLEAEMKRLEERFRGKTVTRPPYWGGFRVITDRIEFWNGRPNRLHDRLRYSKTARGQWRIERLSP
jgi:pyridoxamine 5'-phosphate oxidase